MDLHSNNVVVAHVNEQGKRLGHRKLPCQLAAVLEHLNQAQAQADGALVKLAVESTFNWYWLVDGLMEAGYQVCLANPAAMDQYSGRKWVNDTTDAYFIAELLRLGILETGYIYDRQHRGVRDLLRRRQLLVSKRTALILSLKNQHIRTHGRSLGLGLGQVKTTPPREIAALFEDDYEALAAQITKEQIEHLDHATQRMEKVCWKAARQFDNYPALPTLPGVGPVLAGTITLEVGDIQRFKSPGDFASYCRTVAAKKYSNSKKK
jgi:transposase